MNFKNEINIIKKLTKDKSITFDTFDTNSRPIFISSLDEDIEYTIDKNNKIWKHNGCVDEVIGSIK